MVARRSIVMQELYDRTFLLGPDLIVSNDPVNSISEVVIPLSEVPEALCFHIGEQAIFRHADSPVTIISRLLLKNSCGGQDYYYEVRGKFPQDRGFWTDPRIRRFSRTRRDRFFASAWALQPTVSTLIVRASTASDKE